jgi:hypothetical protein
MVSWWRGSLPVGWSGELSKACAKPKSLKKQLVTCCGKMEPVTFDAILNQAAWGSLVHCSANGGNV